MDGREDINALCHPGTFPTRRTSFAFILRRDSMKNAASREPNIRIMKPSLRTKGIDVDTC
jgi:hypothetical protein